MLKEGIFQLCNCGNPIVHGHFFLADGKRSQAVFSLKFGKQILELAENDTLITSDEKVRLLESLNSSGIPEDGPSEKEVAVYEQGQAESEKEFSRLLSEMGINENRVIRLPAVDFMRRKK